MDFVPIIIAAIVGLGVGAGMVFAYDKKNENGGKNKADDLVRKAKNEASDIVLKARKEAADLAEKSKNEEDSRRKDWKQTEKRLSEREISLDNKFDQIEKRSERLSRQEKEIEELKNEIHSIRDKQQEKLEKIAALSKNEAKEKLIAMTEKDIREDLVNLVVKQQREIKRDIDDTAQSLLVTAMERMSSEVTADRTVTALKLPDDEMKGRIIGREGRNIRALETLTGIDLIIDDTPEAVILSGFDPIRREVARIALEKLIVDGRIHPARIEEMVAKARKEVDQTIKEAGEQATFEADVHGLHPEIIKILGRLKYRTSYGQNVLKHSIEVSHLAGLMAAELGCDVTLAKRGGLIHDIGKALDREIEGSHVEIGVDVARKYRESAAVINCIGAHHGDEEFQTVEAVLVAAADAISAARPGARRETLENYLKRLSKLEEIAESFEGVEKCFAIQAGREIRVVVKPDKIDEAESTLLVRNIVKRIESELEYPGQIKVVIIRETRVVDYAK